MKKAKIYLFFLILFSIISGGVVMGNEIAVDQQSQRRVYGTVTDQDGETLPYVTIIIKETLVYDNQLCAVIFYADTAYFVGNNDYGMRSKAGS